MDNRRMSKTSNQTKDDTQSILQSFFFEIDSAQHSPRFQIIVANGVLELLVNALIEIQCKNGKRIVKNNRDYPHAIKLLLLHEKDLINDFQYHWLNAFRVLRNEAAHGGQFVLTSAILNPFKDLKAADKKTKLNDPANLSVLCLTCVFGFWNYKVDLFYPFFQPNGLAKELGKTGAMFKDGEFITFEQVK
jgi:hypothetical protein